MKTIHSPVLPILLAAVLAGAPGQSAAVDPPGPENTVVAIATGAVGPSDAASEPVVFTGQAAISGKVIYDTVFGAPPELEISVDFSGVTGKGARTGRLYLVTSQAILHRPLLAFDTIEVGVSFAADANALLARSALASFALSYSAASGITATPVRISPVPPG